MKQGYPRSRVIEFVRNTITNFPDAKDIGKHTIMSLREDGLTSTDSLIMLARMQMNEEAGMTPEEALTEALREEPTND